MENPNNSVHPISIKQIQAVYCSGFTTEKVTTRDEVHKRTDKFSTIEEVVKGTGDLFTTYTGKALNSIIKI